MILVSCEQEVVLELDVLQLGQEVSWEKNQGGTPVVLPRLS